MIVKKYILLEVEADLNDRSFTGMSWAEASEGAMRATGSTWYGFPARILSISDVHMSTLDLTSEDT